MSISKNEQALACAEDAEKTFEAVLQTLLPANHKLELNTKTRMLNLLSTASPHLVAQQQFTKNEWSILLTLLLSYPHYASFEVLLASLTLLSPADCRQRLYAAQLSGGQAVKRELKPVHRALSGIRIKFRHVCPQLKISLIRETGYAVTTAEEGRFSLEEWELVPSEMGSEYHAK